MKKLLRKWLKRQIIKKATGMPEQQIFEWIYDSPLPTWRDKLFCLKYANDRAKYAYTFLTNDSSSSSE